MPIEKETRSFVLTDKSEGQEESYHIVSIIEHSEISNAQSILFLRLNDSVSNAE